MVREAEEKVPYKYEIFSTSQWWLFKLKWLGKRDNVLEMPFEVSVNENGKDAGWRNIERKEEISDIGISSDILNWGNFLILYLCPLLSKQLCKCISQVQMSNLWQASRNIP